MGFCSLISMFLVQFNSAVFDVLSENQKTVPRVVTTEKQNGSNHGRDKGSTFWKINNTLRFSLPCSQGQATITCKLFIFAQYSISCPHSGLAQLGASLTANQGVAGSSPGLSKFFC